MEVSLNKKRILIKLTQWFLASVFAISLVLTTGALTVSAKINPIKDTGLGQTGVASGLWTGTGDARKDLTFFIGNSIKIVLSLLGVVFLILTIYAGFQWMLAQGNQGKIKEARDTLLQGAIGLGIIIGSYAITNFVISRILGQ